MSAWDQCVQPALTPTLERIPIYVGVDAVDKRDSTALVAVSFDKKAQMVRLVQHRVFTPAPGDPINFEHTVEATIIDWRRALRPAPVLFDPFQMAAVSQRLAKAHVPIEEYPQTVPNLTAATSNLFDLIQSRSIALYPDAAMRLAVSRAIIVESIQRLAAGQVEAAAQDRRCGRVVDGVLGRGAWAGEARLRSVCARLVRLVTDRGMETWYPLRE